MTVNNDNKNEQELNPKELGQVNGGGLYNIGIQKLPKRKWKPIFNPDTLLDDEPKDGGATGGW